MKRLSLFLIPVVVALCWNCGSSKKTFQTGNYYASVMQSVDKLRKAPNNKTARETLSMAYPMAVEQLNNDVNRMKSSQDQFKNGVIYDSYVLLSNMYDAIRRSPAALEVIPNPQDYYSQLKYYATEAASERYKAGEQALAMGTRPYAMQAYEHFAKADLYTPGYMDVKNKIEEALYYATLKVLVEQVPVPTFQAGMSAQFFQDQIEQFLFNYRENPFIRFYSSKDQNLKDPDQILIFQFDDFVVGQQNTQERIYEARKDSVVVGRIPKSAVAPTTQQEQKVIICHSPPGNPAVKQTLEIGISALQAHIDHGDKIGPCDGSSYPTQSTGPSSQATEYIDVYGTVRATYRETVSAVLSRGLLSMRIIDARSNTVVLHDKFPGEFNWVNRYGSFNGDERALTQEQLNIAHERSVPPPPPQTLFIEFCKPIYGQVTSKVQSYYHNL
jgi:hypothetical protein